MSLRLYSVSSRQKLREDTQGGVKNRSNIKISFKNILSLSLFRLYYLKDGIFKVIVRVDESLRSAKLATGMIHLERKPDRERQSRIIVAI